MITPEQARAMLQDRRLDKVAEATGLSVQTIRELRDNPDVNPKWSTMEAVARYLEGGAVPGSVS